MITPALTIAYYSIKRLFRRKWLLMAVYALPIIGALARLSLAYSPFGAAITWACPLMCALILSTALYMQHSFDRALGLHAGMRSMALPESVMIISSAAAGGIVFASQMAIFEGILAI